MTSPDAFTYASDELEAMARARNYYQWILSRWWGHLGGTVLELGAGIGTFSTYLLQAPVERLVLVEPAPELFRRLRERFGNTARVELWHGTLETLATCAVRDVHCLVSVNVLEHIPDDAATLRSAHDLMVPGGLLLLFVPALPILFGSMDRAFRHVRRYTKPGLATLLATTGFAVRDLRYANMLGTVPWLLAGRILKRSTLSPGMVALADRTLVPLTSWLECRVEPPFGQSLMAVAERA